MVGSRGGEIPTTETKADDYHTDGDGGERDMVAETVWRRRE
uniref:Uncharacterized protein n=1 Tax=Cucumis melo TaxID=3656 RepID=A0A9I9E3Z8_CUCME